MEEHIVLEEESGERIDALLSRYGLTRSRAQQLMEQGLVSCNGAPAGKSLRAKAGDRLTWTLPEAADPLPVPEDIPLDVVFEDGDVIVVNKPVGMVVHPAPGHASGTLVNALLYRCGDSLSGIGGEKRPGIVHRLDKDTSGLIIAAKNDFAHQVLSAQLADRSLSRVYECVVRGHMKQPSGTVDAPIGRHPVDRKRMAVTEKNSRPAVTDWRELARYAGYSHVQCSLRTGRTHQIRVHMAYIGHPLLGDTVYGGKADKGLATQCLHAAELKFIHPRTGESVHLTAPRPDWFEEVLRRLGPKEGD